MSTNRLKRNAAGYRDDTAYKGITGAAHPGEIWIYSTSQGKDKTFLILQNHERFCSALALLNDPDENCIRVEGVGGLVLYTDPRMVQYVYNSELKEYIARTTDSCFENVLEEIAAALGIERKVETKAAEIVPEVQSAEPKKEQQGEKEYFDEMTALFSAEAVKHYCMCNVFKHWDEDRNKAEFYMKKLMKMVGETQ